MKIDYIPFKRSVDVIAEMPRQPGKEFENTETAILYCEIMTRLYELANRAASKEKNAEKLLLNVAHQSCVELSALVNEQTDSFKEAARKSPQWPVLASMHPENHKANIAMFKKLELGKLAGIRAASSSHWRRDDPATPYALDVYTVINANRELHSLIVATNGKTKPWVAKAANLEPLSKKTARLWWSVGKIAFLESYPNPEKLADLRSLVRNKHTEAEKQAQILWLIGRALKSVAAK